MVIDFVFADENPVMFGLRTLLDTPIKGRFYRTEIRKVEEHDTRGQLKIKAIIKEKIVRKKKWALVQYEQLPDEKFWTWLPKDRIVQKN